MFDAIRALAMASQHESGRCIGGDQESVSFRGCELTVAPSSLFSMETVRCVDLSSNALTRFPGARVGREMPCLEVLALSDNLLHVLEDIMALASAPRLCELDVRGNPLRLSRNRLYLLETLLFEEAGVDENILRELHRDEAFKRFTRRASRGLDEAAARRQEPKG
jgi:Leucine-rich repeat (LRR) protein